MPDNSIFIEPIPTIESCWRHIVLMGANDKCYKFALGKSLLELANEQKTFVSLEELAIPFTKFTLEHIKTAPKQGGNAKPPGKFLIGCQELLEEKITKEELFKEARKNLSVKVSVVQKFHHSYNSTESIPKVFFEDDRKSKGGLTFRDDLFRLVESKQSTNLNREIEGRWKLVETAWKLNIADKLILPIGYDKKNEYLYEILEGSERTAITSARDGLNGYQKGKCFYCFRNISALSNLNDTADVDHFLQHHLKFKSSIKIQNLNGVWNLVLACRDCNRGSGGKFGFVPDIKYLYRLNKRNNFLIKSHDPLGKVIVQQTGSTVKARENFLNSNWSKAKDLLVHTWRAPDELDTTF